MSDTVIKLENVGKRFKLYHNIVTGPVQELLFFWKRQQFYKEFMAVKDVSMEIKRGEVVGIIGPNGAGKTTLLKMVAGLLNVDYGKITVNGKVTALMALGVGVHPEFTGRENILYSGMMLGMSKKEVLRKMDGIIEFAEIGRYIDLPFRMYSSGMRARLLFSTFVSIDPDILIVDEALSTGDTYFVRKSSKRIRELCNSGATVVFVSHNLSQVQQLCQRAFLMSEGQLIAEGDSHEIVKTYQMWIFENRQKGLDAPVVDTLPMEQGTGEVQIQRVHLQNREGDPQNAFFTNDPMIVELDYIRLNPEVCRIQILIAVHIRHTGQWVAEYTNFQEIEYQGLPRKQAAIEIGDQGKIRLVFDPCLLLTHEYTLRIVLGAESKEDTTVYADYHNVGSFTFAKPSDPVSLGPIFKMPGKVLTE